MASTMSEQSARPPDDSAFSGWPFPSEPEHADQSAVRRRLPVWLWPTLAALAAGLLVGALLFGGTDGPLARPTADVAGAAVLPGYSADSPLPVSTSLPRSEPVRLDIPAIGASSVLIDLGLTGDGTLEVPVDFAETGSFTGGSWPGDPQGRPALIAGYVDSYRGPAVFYRLRDLSVGNEVLVTRADNTVAVFTVTGSEQYPKADLPADRVPVDDAELVMITCTGVFDEVARSYLDNLVVRARLDVARSLEESDKRAASGLLAPAGDQRNV